MTHPSLISISRRLWQLFADLLFPPRCRTCYRPGERFCQRCVERVVQPGDPRCIRCDMPARGTGSPHACPYCTRQPDGPLDGLRFVGPYDEPLRSAVHLLKFEGYRAVAFPLGQLMADRWQTAAGAALDGIIPVPLHPERERVRGFNQATALASTVADQLALPLRTDLLRRERTTTAQTTLSRQARLHNLEGAFVASGEVTGGWWLLVDDVYTTGATLHACARALKAREAEVIWGLVLARAITTTVYQHHQITN